MNRAGSVLCPILVGRDELLELADRRLADAVAGRGGLLLLTGPAGIGKTRLLQSIRRKARSSGFRVANGSVAPQDQIMPSALVNEFARTLQKTPGCEDLGRDLLAMHPDGDGDALMRRRGYVVEFTDRLAASIDRPTMLDFEDLQWADEISLEIVGEVARRAPQLSLLIVGTYRLEELKPGSFFREWRARLLNQRVAEEARLGPLTQGQTAVMTTLILNTGLPAPREVVAAVHQRTDGIPLHIEELLGALPAEAKTDGAAIRSARVPDTIEDAIRARLDQVSPEAREVARAGAVVGRCFRPEILAGIMDRPLRDLDEPLRELQDHDFLYDTDPGYLDFRHALLRDTLYRSVPAAELRRLHARAAEFGTDLEGQSEIHSSAHYERAGLRGQAYRTARSGAEDARRMGARSEAFALLRRAIDNMPTDMTALERADLYYAYSDAAADLERDEEMIRAANLSREAYLEAGRPGKAAELRINLWSARYKGLASNDDQLADLNDILAELDRLTSDDDTEFLRRVTLILRARTCLDGSRYDEARADLALARALALAAGHGEAVLDVELTEEFLRAVTGEEVNGLPAAFAAARAARDAGYEGTGVTGYRNIAWVSTRVLDYDAARRALAEGLRYADAIEASHCRQQMAVTTAQLDWAGGRWNEATELARQELVERGCAVGRQSATEIIGLIAATRGDEAEARLWLDQSLAQGRVTGEVSRILPSLWALAELELAVGNPAAAFAHCEEALAVAEAKREGASFVPFVVTGMRAVLAARQPGGAEQWRTQAAARVEAFPRQSRAAMAHANGLLQLAAGTLSAARGSFLEALDGWKTMGRSWETAWASLDLAAAELRMGRFASASGLVAEVRSFADGVGSRPLLERTDELSRIARGRGSEEEPWRPLTIREFEVAKLIAAGHTNGEIAAQLVIAPKTVSAHVEHILAKLGATRRAEVAAWATTVAAAAAVRPAVATTMAPDRMAVVHAR